MKNMEKLKKCLGREDTKGTVRVKAAQCPGLDPAIARGRSWKNWSKLYKFWGFG